MNLTPCTVCSQPGAWLCASCGAKCAEHVRRKKGSAVRYKCHGCGQPAELLRATRAELFSFKQRLVDALTNGLLGRPLVMMLACGFLFALSAFVSLLGSVIGTVATIAIALAVLRAAADDEPFDWMRFSDPVNELAIPLGKGLLALSPLVIAVFFGVLGQVVTPYEIQDRHAHSLGVTLLLSPWFWGTAIIGVLYSPLAFLNAATSTSWAGVFDVRAWSAFLKQWKKEYRQVLAVSGGGFLITLVFALLLPKGWIGLFLTGTLAAATGIAVARVMAEFIFFDPEAFGWGRSDEALIDLADPTAPAFEETVVVSEPARTMATTLEGQITAALDAKDAKLALTLYAGVPDAVKQLTPLTLTRMGQAAAFLEEYSVALDTLLAAAKENVPESARPLVIAAKILDERLRDHVGAKRIFEQVIARFPGSQAANFARQQLADPRFFLSSGTG